MTTQEALSGLEARGVMISLQKNGKIFLRFPPGYRRGVQEELMLMVLRSAREEVVTCLRVREDERKGFSEAEPMFGAVTLQTRDIKQAILVGKAVNKGLAVLEGPVIYDIDLREVTLQYMPIIPPAWLDLQECQTEDYKE